MNTTGPTANYDSVALFRHFPTLLSRLPWVPLGVWPTPVEALGGQRGVFIKREDQSSPIYGGNKVRTLEAQMGLAASLGSRRIWATGAYGSNHAVATLVHARRAGLDAGALLFPQPATRTAQRNLQACLSTDATIRQLSHVALLPLAMATLEYRSRRRDLGQFVMAPGGATPVGALGHVSAGLEVAGQIAAGELPPLSAIVLAVGSACTTAGLLLGLRLGERLGIAPAPRVIAARVTPWPVTAAPRIAHLARRCSRHLSGLVGAIADVPYAELRRMLHVDPRYFGRGYGKPTEGGRSAKLAMADAGGPALDLVYSAKAAAALFDSTERPVLFWSTKSTAPMPQASKSQLRAAPAAMRRWLAEPSTP